MKPKAGQEHWGVPLPTHWRVCQIKNVASVTLGKMLQPSDSGADLEHFYLRAANVQPDGLLRLADAKKMWFAEREVASLDLRAGDVVVVEGGVGGYGRAAYIGSDLPNWGFQNSINRLRPRTADGRFLTYYLIAARQRGYVQAICNIVSMPHFTAEKLAAMRLPVPPILEQRAIADYLDHELAQIDALIRKQERLVDTLRERRAAVVERSLIDFAWVAPLRSVLRLIQTGPFGSQLKSDEYVEGGVPVINPSHIIDERVVPDRLVAVTEVKAAELARHALCAGDLVVARRGELGRCAVVDSEGAGALCGTGSALLRPNTSRIDPYFLALVFRSQATRDALNLASVGSTMDNLNAGIIAALRIPLPPVAEQRRLVDGLDEQTAMIDLLIAKAGRFIEVSKERRGALMSAGVLGQIDLSEKTKAPVEEIA